jgi:hypothetical protein
VYYPEARRASVPPANEVPVPANVEPAVEAEKKETAAQPASGEPSASEPQAPIPLTEVKQAGTDDGNARTQEPSIPPEPESAAAWKPAAVQVESWSPGEGEFQAPPATTEPAEVAAPAQTETAPAPPAEQVPRPAVHEDQATVEVGAEIPLEEVLPEGKSVPRKRPMTGAERLMSLTLLDGTKLALPVRRLASKRRPPVTLAEEAKGEKQSAETPAPSRPSGAPARLSQPPAEIVPQVEFTARDVVAALRAAAHGVDPTDILGVEPKWQAILAALLSLMLRKGLIDEKEFVEELKKV